MASGLETGAFQSSTVFRYLNPYEIGLVLMQQKTSQRTYKHHLCLIQEVCQHSKMITATRLKGLQQRRMETTILYTAKFSGLVSMSTYK